MKSIGSPLEIIPLKGHSPSIMGEQQTTFQKVATTTGAQKRADESLMNFDAVTSNQNDQEISSEIGVGKCEAPFSEDVEAQAMVNELHEILNTIFGFNLPFAISYYIFELLLVEDNSFPLGGQIFKFLLKMRVLSKKIHIISNLVLKNPIINRQYLKDINFFDLHSISNSNENSEFYDWFKYRRLYAIGNRQVQLVLKLLNKDSILIQKSDKIVEIIVKCGQALLVALGEALEESLRRGVFPFLQSVRSISQSKVQETLSFSGSLMVNRRDNSVHMACVVDCAITSAKTIAAYKKAMEFDAIMTSTQHDQAIASEIAVESDVTFAINVHEKKPKI